jgi:hypothetical protein
MIGKDSNGQQFHKYQQNKEMHLTSNHLTYKKIMTYDVGNLGPG